MKYTEKSMNYIEFKSKNLPMVTVTSISVASFYFSIQQSYQLFGYIYM